MFYFNFPPFFVPPRWRKQREHRKRRRYRWGRRRFQQQEEPKEARHLPQSGHQHPQGVALPAFNSKCTFALTFISAGRLMTAAKQFARLCKQQQLKWFMARTCRRLEYLFFFFFLFFRQRGVEKMTRRVGGQARVNRGVPYKCRVCCWPLMTC